jgi:hypothetical protein
MLSITITKADRWRGGLVPPFLELKKYNHLINLS